MCEYLEVRDLGFVSHTLFQDHEENLCPAYPVSCPNKCLRTIPRTEVSQQPSLESVGEMVSNPCGMGLVRTIAKGLRAS